MEHSVKVLVVGLFVVLLVAALVVGAWWVVAQGPMTIDRNANNGVSVTYGGALTRLEKSMPSGTATALAQGRPYPPPKVIKYTRNGCQVTETYQYGTVNIDSGGTYYNLAFDEPVHTTSSSCP